MNSLHSPIREQFVPSYTRKSRSNRPITQFACGCLDLFLAVPNYRTDRSKGNTNVKCYDTGKTRLFQVFIHNEEILQVTLFDSEPVEVVISMGDSFDCDGHPLEHVIERLNGLLDSLGAYRILPEGVRVFKDREDDLFYFGKGKDRVPVGLLYAHKIKLAANPAELQLIPGSTIPSIS